MLSPAKSVACSGRYRVCRSFTTFARYAAPPANFP